jgi:hypothetical protein
MLLNLQRSAACSSEVLQREGSKSVFHYSLLCISFSMTCIESFRKPGNEDVQLDAFFRDCA